MEKLLSRFRGECNRAVGFFIRPGFLRLWGARGDAAVKHTYDQFFFLGDDHFERNLAIVHVAEFSQILFGLIFSATVPLSTIHSLFRVHSLYSGGIVGNI